MASIPNDSEATGLELVREQEVGHPPYEENHSTIREIFETTRQSAITNLQQFIDLQRQSYEPADGEMTHSQRVEMAVTSSKHNTSKTRTQLALAECRTDLRSMDRLLTEIAAEESRSLPKTSTAVIMSISFLGQTFSHNMMVSIQKDYLKVARSLEDLRSKFHHDLLAGKITNATDFRLREEELVKRLHSLDMKHGSWKFLRYTLIVGLVTSAMFFAYRYGRYALAKWSRRRTRRVQKELEYAQPDSTNCTQLDGLPFYMMWIVNKLLSR